MSSLAKYKKQLKNRNTGKEYLHQIWKSFTTSKKLRIMSMLFVALMIPVLNFYLLEGYTHNGFEEIRFWSQVFNVILFELLLLILFFVCRNLRVALSIHTIAAMLIGLTNYYVYTFRSLPLVPWDFLSIKTAFSVVDNYDFTPTKRVVIVLIGFIVLLVIEQFIQLRLDRLSWVKSVCLSLGTMGVLVLFCVQLQNEAFQNKHFMYNKLFTPVYMWQVNGFGVTFVMDLPFLTVDKPEGYSKEKAISTLEEEEGKKETSNSELPNIIVVMNESFSDLSVLGNFTSSEDYMPFFHQLENGADNTVTGYLNVSVVGGNTPNTEFEFLTGNTMAFLPQGSIPFQQYINSTIPSLPNYLKTLGYGTYALHPYQASGWDRDTVYPLLGFDVSYFIDDFTGSTYVRNYVSDDSSINKIIEIFEQKEEDKPAFIFNVTMQNHGSYSDAFSNFTPDITVEGIDSFSLSTYLSLIKKTDASLEKLLTYFESVNEPTVVVFFGDHQPNDTIAAPILALNDMVYNNLSEEEEKLRYQVPYVIWANYDIEEESQADTSANYLSTKVFETANIPLSQYQNFLLEQNQQFPILSTKNVVDEQGKAVEFSQVKKDLLEYQQLQYYQLFDYN